MASSSHDAGVQHLQYGAFHGSSDNHHVYAGLTPWAASHTVSRSSSSMFQSPGSNQHQLPAPNTQSYGPLDYVNLHPIQTSWSQPNHRPGVACDENLCPRPSDQYGYALPDGPGSGSDAPCPPQPSLRGVHEILRAVDAQSQNSYATSQHYQVGNLASYASPSASLPFQPSTQGAAPVARLLNYPSHESSTLHVGTQDPPSQPPMVWPSRTDTLAAQNLSQEYAATNGSIPFSLGIAGVTGSSAQASGPWTASSHVLRNFDRFHDLEPGWPSIEQQPQQGMLAHNVSHLDPVSPADQGYRPPVSSTASTSTVRRHVSDGKLPKMPSSFVERQKKSKVSKRKGPLDKEKRENAHRRRQRGPGAKPPCTRCRFYKNGCDEGDTCSKCLQTMLTARVFHVPCCRDQIEDTNVVRRCNGRFNQKKADFLDYRWKANKPIIEMRIIWNLPGFGPVRQSQPFPIRFREYEPEGTMINSTESQWKNTNGELVRVEQPPYAVYDTRTLAVEVEAWFESNLSYVDEWILDRNRYDEAALLTYREAIRLRNKQGPWSELLTLALKLQYLSVISQGYGSVWSENIPGIRVYDFRALGHSEYEAYDRNSRDRPLSKAIDHQMDVSIVRCLQRYEQKFLKALSHAIFKTASGEKPWYVLFLALFIVFKNMEYIHQGAQSYIKSKSGTHIASQVKSVVSDQIETWNHTVDVLRAHWKVCLRGFKPLVLARENPEELRANGKLPDSQAFQYMLSMVSILERRGPSRFAPPLTGFSPVINSTDEDWVAAHLKEAGG